MSFPDTIVLFILALLLFGPKKLPQIARQIGKALGEFRRASNEFKAQIEAEISQLEFEEKRKEREKQEQEQQKALPKPEPVSEAVSRYSMAAETSESATSSEPATPSPDVNTPAHTSHA
ncbi:MAG TPA: twin-arginine translocase TatA/TatE family subunit [Terriglobales bacterium]|nr:twin-arginine translocase TatA/TatE family subunit [Terriglobales bacterium]